MSLGDPMAGLSASFMVTGPRRVTRVLVDLLGDGEPGWQLTFDEPFDGRNIRGLSIRPWRVGTFNLSISAEDEEHCTGATGAPRPINVRP